MSGLEDAVAAWAASEPSVHALVLIGSRVRESTDEIWRADVHSDWDFQIITSQPRMFSDATWARALPGVDVRAYAVRSARLGGVPKVNVVFTGVEADFVILPAGPLRFLKLCVGLGLHRRSATLRRRLQDLTIVVRPGWKFLKDQHGWERFYQRSVAEISDYRLQNDEIRALAEGFVCDYVAIGRKIERGELRAAQRLLHRDLVEINFRLLHELKLRRGERTFPEARRLERVATKGDLDAVTVSAEIEAAALKSAVEKSAASFRELAGALIGETWHWPDLRQ